MAARKSRQPIATKNQPAVVAPLLENRVIYPVIKTPGSVPDFLLELVPTEPWPSHISLSGSTPDEYITLVVSTVAFHSVPKPTSLSQVTSYFSIIAPGGLAAVDGNCIVVPGCCCGLEGWREWYLVLAEEVAPWMGHDPSPGIEDHEDEYWIWPDWGDTFLGKPIMPVIIHKKRFREELDEVERDLNEFLMPLIKYCERIDPTSAAEFCERFRKMFIR